MNQIQYILWDWNGTLLNDVEECIKCMNGLLNKREMATLDRSRYREIFTFPVITYYERLGFDFHREPFNDLAEEFVSQYRIISADSKLHTGVLLALDYLKSKNYNQMILSAMEQEALYAQTALHKIDHFFEEIVGLQSIHASSKIESAIKLISDKKIDPEQCIMIGDTFHDYEVARTLGTGCLLVNNGHQQLEDLTFHEKVQIIDDLRQIPQIM